MNSWEHLKQYAAGSEYPPKQPGVLRMYLVKLCPFAHRAQLIMRYKGIEYDDIYISLKNKPEWFVERNPAGQVPVLELPDGTILVESPAVCEYLDEVYGEEKLISSDPVQKAHDRAVQEFIGQYLPSFYSIAMMKSEEKTITEINGHWERFDKILAKRGGTYFGRDKPCLLDFYLWPHIERVPGVLTTVEPRAAITVDKFPNLTKWIEAMEALPAVNGMMLSAEAHNDFANSLLPHRKGNQSYGLKYPGQ